MAAGNERIALGIDGNVVMLPIDPAPTPERTEHRQFNGRRIADPEARLISEADRSREGIRRIRWIGPCPVNGGAVDRHAGYLRLCRQDRNRIATGLDRTTTLRRLLQVSCRH